MKMADNIEERGARELAASLRQAIVEKASVERLGDLLSQGADVHRREPGVLARETVLPLAASSGSVEALERLLEELDKPSAGATRESRRELLWAALSAGASEVERVELVLPRLELDGAELSQDEAQQGLSAMRVAAALGAVDSLKKLMDRLPPESSRLTAEFGYEPVADHLGMASAWGEAECAEAILNHPKHGLAMGPKRVWEALKETNYGLQGLKLRMLKTLLPRCGARMLIDGVEETALALATRSSGSDCVKWLLTESGERFTASEVQAAIEKARSANAQESLAYLTSFAMMEAEREEISKAAPAPVAKKAASSPRM